MLHLLGDLWQVTWPPLCSNKPNCKFAGKLKTRCCIWEVLAQAKFLDTHLQVLSVLWEVLIWLSDIADEIKVIFGNKFHSDFCFIISLLNIILIGFEGKKDGLSFYLNIDQNSKEQIVCLPVETVNTLVVSQIGIVRPRCLQRDSCREFWPLMQITRPYISPAELHNKSDLGFVNNLTYQFFAFLSGFGTWWEESAACFWHFTSSSPCSIHVLSAFTLLESNHLWDADGLTTVLQEIAGTSR